MIRKNGPVVWLIFAAISCAPFNASADRVYKWEDEDGVVHYSDRVLDKAASEAKLPPIMRGEVKLGEQKLQSCADHGGIDCQAGPDKDGSVICYDGFTGAATRYRFNCNSPKLTVADISELRSDGSFAVVVRNSKSVAAKKPAVSFLRENGKEVPLKGPEEIEPFGVAEFTLLNQDAGGLKAKPNAVQLKVTCGNCP